jgi:hypothetical protein
MIRPRLHWTLALLLFACAERSPRAVLDEYREALRRGDTTRAIALSDASTRAAIDRPISPEEARATAARLDRAQDDGTATCDFDLGAGEHVHLVKEKDGWKIASGGLELGRFDTPEHALQSFFAGVDAKRWPLVRAAMPKRHREDFKTDDALAAHVESIRARIDRAKSAIGDLGTERAHVEGDKAEITYGAGKRATFEREDGAWCVLDLE